MVARKTALVTGASMGLGRDYAKLCAADGMDLVLVARSRDKLEALARELEAAHRITAHVVPADLDARGSADEVAEAVSKLGVSVDVLVNNAGFGNTGAFVEADLAKELSMVHVNIEALVALTHHFGRGMVSRGSGRILLVASTAAFQPGPGMAVYCASKAFVRSFGEALAYELAGTGVTVTVHCPGATETEFARTAGNDKTPIFSNKGAVADAVAVTRHGYAAMKRGTRLSVHGFVNKVMAYGAPFTPTALTLAIAASLMGFRGTDAKRLSSGA